MIIMELFGIKEVGGWGGFMLRVDFKLKRKSLFCLKIFLIEKNEKLETKRAFFSTLRLFLSSKLSLKSLRKFDIRLKHAQALILRREFKLN